MKRIESAFILTLIRSRTALRRIVDVTSKILTLLVIMNSIVQEWLRSLEWCGDFLPHVLANPSETLANA